MVNVRGYGAEREVHVDVFQQTNAADSMSVSPHGIAVSCNGRRVHRAAERAITFALA